MTFKPLSGKNVQIPVLSQYDDVLNVLRQDLFVHIYTHIQNIYVLGI